MGALLQKWAALVWFVKLLRVNKGFRAVQKWNFAQEPRVIVTLNKTKAHYWNYGSTANVHVRTIFRLYGFK